MEIDELLEKAAEGIVDEEVDGLIELVYACYLPFRIQTGKIRKFDCSYGKRKIDVWVYNEIPSYQINDSLDSSDLDKQTQNFSQSRSKLLIHLKTPSLLEEDLEYISELIKGNEGQTTGIERNIQHILPAINRLLIACNGANPELLAGYAPKKFTWMYLIFKKLLVDESVLVVPRPFKFSNVQVEEILMKIPPMEIGSAALLGDGKPFDDKTINEIQNILDNFLDRMLLFELLFEARSLEFENPRGALIQAAMAFENAIWLVLEYEFERKCLAAKESLEDEHEISFISEKCIKSLVKDFGRQLQLTLLVRSVPFLFHDSENILQPSEIRKVLQAIKARNKLVHSKKTSLDDYYWFEMKWEDLKMHYKLLEGLTRKLAAFIMAKMEV